MQSKLVADVTAQIELIGVTPLSFGKYHDAPHLSNEKELKYEERTCAEKLHYTDSGEVFVPAMMAKKSLDAGVKRSGKKVAGRRMSTYSKFFESGQRQQVPA